MSARPLRLLLDSASVAHWEAFASLGVFAGITTNPLLMQGQEWLVP